MIHLHGFGLSGRYLLPTAERLARRVPHARPGSAGFRPQRQAARRSTCPISPTRRRGSWMTADRVGEPGRQLDGLPGDPRVRAPLPRAPRAGRARVLRRRHPQPAAAPRVGQLARTAGESQEDDPVAAPTISDSAFPARSRFPGANEYPSLQRLLELEDPDPGRVRRRGPLLPQPTHIKEVASQDEDHVLIVVPGRHSARDQLRRSEGAGPRRPSLHRRSSHRRCAGSAGCTHVPVRRGTRQPRLRRGRGSRRLRSRPLRPSRHGMRRGHCRPSGSAARARGSRRACRRVQSHSPYTPTAAGLKKGYG